MKYSISSFTAGTGCPKIEDIHYLPDVLLDKEQVRSFVRREHEAPWLRTFGDDMPKSLEEFPESIYMALMPEYDMHRLRRRREPDWVSRLPVCVLAELRKSYIIRNLPDPLAIVPVFPTMGLGYIVEEGGLIESIERCFGLRRLQRVRQLGLLHDPVLHECDRTCYSASFVFEHNRLVHSYDVAAVGTLILENNPCLSETEKNTARAAFFAHDTLTPAGGDTTKLVDMEAFDEDANFPTLFAKEGWAEIRERYRIDEALLTETILGKGRLGRILDVADKSSYMARDAVAYLNDLRGNAELGNYGGSYDAIAHIFREDSHPCGLWEAVEVEESGVVINDPAKLDRFLRLRALLFKNLYYNPWSRFLEYMVSKAIIGHLYRTGEVTKEELLLHSDEWLMEKVEKVIGRRYFLTYGINPLEGSYMKEFPTEIEARAFMDGLRSDTRYLALADVFNSKTSTGVDKFRVKDGSKRPLFSEACPREAAAISEMMRFAPVSRVFVYDMDTLRIPAENRKNLKAIFQAA